MNSDFGHIDLNTHIVIISVIFGEAANLLLLNGKRAKVLLHEVKPEVMEALRELKFIENVGGESSDEQMWRFTELADRRLRFFRRIKPNLCVQIREQEADLNGQWRKDLQNLAGPTAAMVERGWRLRTSGALG